MRFPVLSAAICALALVAAQTPAEAQRPQGAMSRETGTRLGARRTNPASEYGMRFARCLAGFQPREVAEWLATMPGTPASRASQQELLARHQQDSRCVQMGGIVVGGSEIEMSERLMRGNLAQALYVARFPDAAPPVISEAQPTTIPVEVYNARVAAAVDPQSEVIRIFGDCVAAADPMRVDTLVRSDVGSPEENSAINALGPVMGPCLWNGQSIEFSSESLRAALGDGLYRKAFGAPSAPAG
ncbi:MAG: hypothetical protein H7X93_06195 [Sphingomonadaceae bacterium]|nr:hypothetical protein [Sphingomonadaceae bacterium]